MNTQSPALILCMRRLCQPLAFLVSIIAVAPVQAADLLVSHAWIEEGPPGLTVLAGYLDLANRGDHELTIKQISSTIAERIEIHRTEIEANTVTMRRIPTLVLAPHSHLDFKPGGYHLMIFGVANPPRAGEKVRLDITTDAGNHVLVDADVRKLGEEGGQNKTDNPDNAGQPDKQ